jgi:sulfoxide reductase heme-binding subunit YedZ
MLKRIGGKNWQRLHRLTYVAGVAGVVHFWMIVKSDIFYPAVFGVVLGVMLGYRLVVSKGKKPRVVRPAVQQ